MPLELESIHEWKFGINIQSIYAAVNCDLQLIRLIFHHRPGFNQVIRVEIGKYCVDINSCHIGEQEGIQGISSQIHKDKVSHILGRQ